ncbi:MAG TPA: pirin family protein [Thermoanaerobaculia bacterium]|jgi:redox-sensitive bicupin YhaK (pirin superfamily)|nr:pirin family protein [Thermoanaerobaculia bacterium]
MTLTILEPRAAALELDGMMVGRILPSARRRTVGPFIFFDVMGPAEFASGKGMDVRPHPHIGLATVTYLFDGEIVHRDSLGYTQPIRPGEINWMTAGRGIAHSERMSGEVRARGSRLHGIQLWVALPDEAEEAEPSFDHYDAGVMPEKEIEGARVRLLAGSAYGMTSPVKTYSPMVYAEIDLRPGATLALPEEHPELAIYEVDTNRMVLFDEDTKSFTPEIATHLMLIGGTSVGKRHIWWNFVSSSKERIERAKADWRARRFATVVDDEVEFVELPER